MLPVIHTRLKTPGLAALCMCLPWYNTECNPGVLLCKKNLEERGVQRVKFLLPLVVPQRCWMMGAWLALGSG
jgi:hypothetical protein